MKRTATAVEISPDSDDWRHLIERSHQTSLYVLPEWVKLQTVACFGAYRGTQIVGGMVVAPTRHPLPFIPYQGLLLTRREDRETTDVLLDQAEAVGRPISVWNCPALVDIRPFHWRFYESRVLWTDSIRYTYICTPKSEPEPRARALITHSEVGETTSDDWLSEWKQEQWVGAEEEKWMELILGLDSVKVWSDDLSTVVCGVDLQGRGYYLASVGRPTNVLHFLARKYKSFEMVGCNSPDRALFKRSLGGTLRSYYGMVAA